MKNKLSEKELKELFERTYEITNSMFPLGDFLNDIRDNKSANYNKEQAYYDFKLIVDMIYSLMEENKKYKEKETPKKPIEDLFESKKHFKICPSCWEKDIKTFVYGKYCDECGQRLE